MNLPPCCFYILGMGNRVPLLYIRGELIDLTELHTLRRWDVVRERVEPSEYRVTLDTRGGGVVRIWEDETGIWLEETGVVSVLEDGLAYWLDAEPANCNGPILLFEGAVNLPRFDGNPRAAVLRALHQEILVNIIAGGPTPNLLVYPRWWYRDAAMVLMVLQRTGNLHLVEEWVMGLREPFDRNNAGHREPDNLGQLLYMISLCADASHPAVGTVLQAAGEFRRGNHIVGITDGAEHPVYQTKWLKLGLRALGLDDPWEIPAVQDSYSSLFWMDFRDEHVECPPFDERAAENYPYLAWAERHFHAAPPPQPVGVLRYPMTWEANASEARYEGMETVHHEYAARRIAAPHTWHAAEMFLYFHDLPTGGQ